MNSEERQIQKEELLLKSLNCTKAPENDITMYTTIETFECVPENDKSFDSIIATLRTYCEIKNMIAETTKELSVTLADIKREALKDDFIHTTKNKIYNKDPNVPKVFFTLWRCSVI